MADARRALSEEERARVSAAVAAAERRTAAEIVCALATESGRYDRAEGLIGLVCALLALVGLHVGLAPQPVALVFQAGAVVGGFLLGSLLASHVHALRGACVGRGEADEEVRRAAGHVFQARRLASTRARGGVLVYLSLFEREVVILADDAAHAALGDAGLLEVRDLMLARLRAGDLAGALVTAVEGLGERLAGPLPVAPDDQDELPDDLVVFHPRP